MSNIDIIEAVLPDLRDALLNTPTAYAIEQHSQDSYAEARRGLAAELSHLVAVVHWMGGHKNGVARLYQATVGDELSLPTKAM